MSAREGQEDPVAILSELVSFRSDVGGEERPLANRLAELLRERNADEVIVGDVPRVNAKPASYVYAKFGEPKLLVNSHLDTVPPNSDWSGDPFEACIKDGKLYALGASDTKGAAAAILAALVSKRPTNTGILFSGDEEFSSAVMQMFVESEHMKGLERAIVCEPTRLSVGTRHRGFIAFEIDVSSTGGHSSLADGLPSPIGMLSQLAVTLYEWGVRHRTLGPKGFEGMCMNLAKLDGGIAFNVIPAHAKLVVSVRPPPGSDTEAIREELEEIIKRVVPTGMAKFLRTNSPFETRTLSEFDLPQTNSVDLGFWTEAAVLAEAGIDSVVMGPGDIAQAHAPDEWVTLDQLKRARELFVEIFGT